MTLTRKDDDFDKLVIEIPAKLAKKFRITCAQQDLSHNSVILSFIVALATGDFKLGYSFSGEKNKMVQRYKEDASDEEILYYIEGKRIQLLDRQGALILNLSKLDELD